MTLLESVWYQEGDTPAQVEQAILSHLATGELVLTGSFKGQEREFPNP